jgi:hypothetical protein
MYLSSMRSLALILASSLAALSLAQDEPKQVIRVAMSPERLAEFAEHTKDHLGLFDTSTPAFALDAFISPGSRRDPLPAIESPERVPAKGATFPPSSDLVVEVVVDGQAVAYPVSVLTYHGVVNDTIGDTPVAVWFDAISNGLAVFRRDVQPARGETTECEFRLAGLLVHGSAALYDARSLTLFSPLDGVGATGKYAKSPLTFLPFRVTTFDDFIAVHPSGETLAKPRGSTFDYGVNPFAGYQSDPNFVYMQVTNDLRVPPKTPGVGVASGDEAHFIPFAAMLEQGRSIMTFDGPFEASLTPDKTLFIKQAPPGATIAQAYFANWVAAHPTSKVMLAVEVRDLPEESMRKANERPR